MDNWEIYYRTHSKGVGKVLTGSPPLSFASNGQPLADYRIYGNSGGVGDRTKNLFNPNLTQVNGYINNSGDITISPAYQITTYDYISIASNTDYVISGLSSENGAVRIAFYDKNKEFISRIVSPRVINPIQTFNTNSAAYIRCSVDDNVSYIQIELGSTPTAYEPYGYKIPIVCGETTTNIYLDEPLNEGESISMSDTGISIPTINGTNILTVNTEVQPSKMYIKYGGSSNVNQSLMKYLEYKYKFAKE